MQEDNKTPAKVTDKPGAIFKPKSRNTIFMAALVAVAILLSLTIYGATKSDNKPSNNKSATLKNPASVSINGSGFYPAFITISKGDTINWTNKDDVKHQIVLDTYSGKDNFSDFKISDPIAQGGIYGITFSKAGAYSYHDQDFPKYKGSIEVK